jgi:starch synthase
VNILLASSELFPFSKTGGLADMVSALGKALAHEGQTVSTITPLYRGIQKKFPNIKDTAITLEVPLGTGKVSAKIWSLDVDKNLIIYFVDQPDFYDRPALYVEKGRDYPDNAARFIFFSKCVVELAQKHLQPDVVHVHDWQVGPVPLLIRHQERIGAWKNRPATGLTIHNLAYQGVFPQSDYHYTNLPDDYYTVQGVEYYGYFNCLKAAIVYSDIITTVSPRYAREILTEQYGCGLDGVLRSRQQYLVGILNGVDYSEWRTQDNPFLKHSYSLEQLEAKNTLKLDLQTEMSLPQNPDVPLFATISRLADQKGFDILIPALEEMISAEMQFVVLGSGDAEYERGLLALAQRNPNKVAVKIGYDHALSHRIEAGADFFLMPSRFEPCGLNQMYSLHYGTIPIVRITGGLDDSVTDINEDIHTADGIKFLEYTPRALVKAIRKSLALYEDKELLHHFRTNGMLVDFSWEHTSQEYLKTYQRALRIAGRSS